MGDDMKNIRTDMAIDKSKKLKTIYKYNNIIVKESKKKNKIYHTIKYNSIENKIDIINVLKKELLFFINNNSIEHILIIGLGNESNTADSIGPKTVKKIKVNFNTFNIKVSALIPGVLGITGIDTNRIIKSVIKEIKPNLIIVIDALVTNKISTVNNVIELSNTYLNPGSGIYGNNKDINSKIPALSIGIPTAIEYIKNNVPFILTPTNIDNYINKVSNIISQSINEVIYKDLIDTPE